MTAGRVAALVMLIVFAGGLGGWTTIRQLRADRDGADVSRARVSRGTVSARMTVTGTLLPRYRTTLSFPAPGRVIRVDVQLRERVVPGQVLAALDSHQLLSTVRRREFEVERAELRARQRRPVVDDDEVQSRLQALDIEQAAFELALARAQLEAATLRSPVEGTVAHVGVQVGDVTAAAGNAAHVIIAEDDQYIIEIEGDEGEIRRIRTGAAATVFFAPPDPAILPAVVDGRPVVRRINTAAGGATTLVATVVLLRNPDDVQIGRAARVEIEVDSRDQVPVVPIQAVFRHDSRDRVLVWEGGRWAAMPVALGLVDESVAELLEGPPIGAIVAIAPSQRLRQLAAGR